MRLRRSEPIAFLILLALGQPAQGQVVANPEEGGATFLLLPVGARASALGQAAIADEGNPEAIFWNPAGLATLRSSQVALHYASTFASDNTALSGNATIGRLGVVGLAFYLVDFGSQEVVPGPGLPIGRLSVKNLELLASYGTELTDDLAFGVNYKLIQFRQDCSGDCTTARSLVGTTHGIDVGIQYAFGANDELRIGMAIRNAGFALQLENRDQADPLPTRVQVGVAYRVPLSQPRGMEERFDARILVDLQDAWGQYDNPDARIGIEFGYGEIVRLRSGYAILHSETSGPSVGVGLRFGRLELDFARIFYDSSSFDEPVHISLRASL
ncbi:MAG: PorV/PorQ family protein [Gemmatimonadota bacterium]|nr:PorV/PorQ family protein [Gemmatimonadota bacterium]MDH3369649.1 PorV/PorQ family protein [Gemmatimonadota bacterium]MDH3477090.1 PorV/PorQ family protein [Gemmatimonadota bacterium]MDH3568775.1 PorV/PorQ family protein [Gemmatimonadota bacterium]